MIRFNLLDPSGARFFAPDGSFAELVDRAHGFNIIVRRSIWVIRPRYYRKVGPWRVT